jgi:hypothetical protein
MNGTESLKYRCHSLLRLREGAIRKNTEPKGRGQALWHWYFHDPELLRRDHAAARLRTADMAN